MLTVALLTTLNGIQQLLNERAEKVLRKVAIDPKITFVDARLVGDGIRIDYAYTMTDGQPLLGSLEYSVSDFLTMEVA